MRYGWFALCVLMACGVDEAAIGESSLDETGDALAASVPLVPLAEGDTASAAFTSKVKYVAYTFSAHAGQHIDVFASDATKGHLDTILQLYKVSATTGRPTGAAITSNDDTANIGGWSTYPEASSIDDFDLYTTRTYCIVVSTYNHVAGTASVTWVTHGGSQPSIAFPGTGAGKALSWNGVTSTALPVSSDVAALTGGSIVAARVKLAPSALAAILADDTRFHGLVFDMLYNTAPPTSTTQQWHDQGTAQPGDKAGAFAWLDTQWALPSNGADGIKTENTLNTLLPSMFADGAFATSSVQIVFTHYDNGDDTNADGVLAIDSASGELRTVALVNWP
jgi:hypothetical protein